MPQKRPNRTLGPRHDDFWAGCADGELRLQRCAACGTYRHPPGPLCEPLLDTTILPAGQRMTRQLRSYLELRIGDDFRVDSHVREFMTSSSGTTVADLVAHWEATRDTPRSQPDAQFEYNRFSVRWHAAHVGGTPAECRAAWFVYRSLPLDQRPFPEE